MSKKNEKNAFQIDISVKPKAYHDNSACLAIKSAFLLMRGRRRQRSSVFCAGV
jgi:hypothetical protein